jgi:hypothetical protein
MRFENISLQQFGRLMPSFLVGKAAGHLYWACLCDCGATVVVASSDLRTGKTKSCGCLRQELATAWGKKRFSGRFGENNPHFKHGHATSVMGETPTHISWAGMIQRCTDSNRNRWSVYGGAGVKVCDRWLDFRNFLADMGERPEGTTLGRFSDVGNYEPGNCEWQTPKQQGVEKRVHHQLQFLDA